MASKHEKLFVKMQRSEDGWRPNDLHALYKGFGFEYREGANHTIYKHPKHMSLRATVARHNKLGKAYISDAVKLIQQLKYLEGKSDEK